MFPAYFASCKQRLWNGVQI